MGGVIKTLPFMVEGMDRQTLKLEQCLDWISEHYLVPNDACGQKNQLPISNEAKKCYESDCVLMPPPHGFLMDRQTDRQTLKLKYCLRLIGECSKVSNTPSR